MPPGVTFVISFAAVAALVTAGLYGVAAMRLMGGETNGGKIRYQLQ